MPLRAGMELGLVYDLSAFLGNERIRGGGFAKDGVSMDPYKYRFGIMSLTIAFLGGQYKFKT